MAMPLKLSRACYRRRRRPTYFEANKYKQVHRGQGGDKLERTELSPLTLQTREMLIADCVWVGVEAHIERAHGNPQTLV